MRQSSGQSRDLAPAAPPTRPVPLCRGLLLCASHEPHGEREWEQWHTTIRKAIRKEAISPVMDLGTPGEQVAYRLIHLIHAHCRRRLGGIKPSTLS